MRCAPLTRLALALDATDPAVAQHAQAAERAQLDLVTLSASASPDDLPHELTAAHDRVLAATSRIGVVSAAAAAGQTVPDRSGVLGPSPARAQLRAAEADLALSDLAGHDDADLLFVRGAPAGPGRDQLDPIRAARPVRIFADVVLALGPGSAERAATAPAPEGLPVVTGTPMQAMATLNRLKSVGGLDGFRLHLADVATDLPLLVSGLVPALRDHDAFRRGYETRTLRGHLELPPIASPVSAEPAAAAVPAADRG